MPTNGTVHPYFTAKASQWMRRAGGDPAAAGDLARWAQIAWHAARPHNTCQLQRRGVIIAADGTLLAETRSCGRGPGPMVDHVDVADLRRLTGATYGDVSLRHVTRVRRADRARITAIIEVALAAAGRDPAAYSIGGDPR